MRCGASPTALWVSREAVLCAAPAVDKRNSAASAMLRSTDGWRSLGIAVRPNSSDGADTVTLPEDLSAARAPPRVNRVLSDHVSLTKRMLKAGSG